MIVLVSDCEHLIYVTCCRCGLTYRQRMEGGDMTAPNFDRLPGPNVQQEDIDDFTAALEKSQAQAERLQATAGAFQRDGEGDIPTLATLEGDDV